MASPSQAQQGVGKFLEGLFGGMTKSAAQDEKDAYMRALLAQKGEQALALKATPTTTIKRYEGLPQPKAGGAAPKILPSAGAKDYDKILRSAIAAATGQSLNDTFDPYSFDPSTMSEEQRVKANQLIKSQVAAQREEFNRRSAGQPNLVPYDLNVPDYFIAGESSVTDPLGFDKLPIIGDRRKTVTTSKVNPDWSSFVSGKSSSKPKAPAKSKAASRLDAALGSGS